uniref:Uncharacterized protein n=1 Tax=Siphoviridae sp. ctLfk13 TaxID=2826251 RepID=A0A8S5N1X1_9CAUD|nr:MAG TPA: hypothetical protein [Siphoviridae sp. ctLfk13]
MIINFSELTIPFHRLAAGAVLISPDDTRFLKSIGEDMEDYWVHGKDLWSNQAASDDQMKKEVGDGEGWKLLP